MENTNEQKALKAIEASKHITQIMEASKQIDVEYLTEALKEMRENHSMRDSMAVLNPSPFTHIEQQELNKSKLEQLELILKLAKNVNKIKHATIKLHEARKDVDSLTRLFGG